MPHTFPIFARREKIGPPMRRLILAGFLWTPLAVALMASPGCGNACEDLADVCGDCTDEDYRESCELTVADRNQEVCSFRFDELRPICLGEEPTSTSSGDVLPVGSGGAGGAGGTGGAGAGGAGAAGGSGGSGGAAGGAGGASAGGSGGT